VPAPAARTTGGSTVSKQSRARRVRLNRTNRGGLVPKRPSGELVDFKVPWAPKNGAPPMAGEVVRLVNDQDETTTCVGLTENGKPVLLPHGAAGVMLVGVRLAQDTGHATWELHFKPGDVVSG
jgi:hypothetical protein